MSLTVAPQDEYSIGLADEREAEDLHALMNRVWREMDDKSLFAVDDLDAQWVRSRLTDGGFAVTARTADGELAGMVIVCRYNGDEENLGRDLGYPPEALAQVCNLECAAVLPDHRGHGLQTRMLVFAEESLRDSDVRVMAMTVSPYNQPSLRSARKAGFRVVLTKNKYGGLLRHVLTKPVPRGREE